MSNIAFDFLTESFLFNESASNYAKRTIDELDKELGLTGDEQEGSDEGSEEGEEEENGNEVDKEMMGDVQPEGEEEK